jgi:hypothetical protein
VNYVASTFFFFLRTNLRGFLDFLSPVSLCNLRATCFLHQGSRVSPCFISASLEKLCYSKCSLFIVAAGEAGNMNLDEWMDTEESQRRKAGEQLSLASSSPSSMCAHQAADTTWD